MIKVVLDTNIVVSAALSPKGNPAKILNLVSDNKEIKVYYNPAIIAEYEDVLSREHLKLPVKIQNNIVKTIKEVGILIEPLKSDMPLPDESDMTFYDTAKAVEAYLITGEYKALSNRIGNNNAGTVCRNARRIK